MIYVALLRGINVGGNSKVSMSQLKATFERAGMQDVQTYINSGNIIFRDSSLLPNKLTTLLEQTIKKEFGFAVKVILRDKDSIVSTAKALPKNWTNDNTMKCDVMFLSDTFDDPKVLDQLPITLGIDDVKYVSGTIFWRIDRAKVTKSRMTKLVGTNLYKNMTVRNCNTVRKLSTLIQYLD